MVTARVMEPSLTMSLLLVRSRAPVQLSLAPSRVRALSLLVELPLGRIWTVPAMESVLTLIASETREAPETTERLPAPEMAAVVLMVLTLNWREPPVMAMGEVVLREAPRARVPEPDLVKVPAVVMVEVMVRVLVGSSMSKVPPPGPMVKVR